jgi:hypothetical protein
MAVEKVGYPLEIAAKRILKNNDYYVSHSYYSRPDEVIANIPPLTIYWFLGVKI